MQEYFIEDVRSSSVLTTSYVAGTVLGHQNVSPSTCNQLNVLVGFTIGQLTSAEVKVEFSHDGTTWYQETFTSISGGTATLSLGFYTFTATGNYVISVPIKYNYVRISAKGTGTVTDSLLSLRAILGEV